MVFDAIYDTFAKIVDSKMKDKNVDDEFFGDIVLKEMAKALTVAIYRNGTIEDFMLAKALEQRILREYLILA